MSEKQIEPSPSVKKIEYPSKFSVKLKHYLYNLRHYARYPLRSGGAVTFASSIVILSIVVNAGIYLWKGSEHPTNNFRWLIWKHTGKLPEELKKKEDLITEWTIKNYEWKKEYVPVPGVRPLMPARDTSLGAP
uniref:Uncharacterized protein n=1 Tax=Acrobeloides nanus TaxID=290746 RepID=A0A914BXD7_9BILA